MTPDRFRECLALLRWSQRGFADILQMDESYVRRMARGTRPVHEDIAAWLERRAQAMAADPPPARTGRWAGDADLPRLSEDQVVGVG